jgi:transposase InsO family protein
LNRTSYRWQKRYEPLDLTTLEERSHCPHHRRQPTWSFPLERKVLTLRLQFPRWGKDKLAVLLRQQGEAISTSMVGRILTRLKHCGQLREAPRPAVPGSRRALRVRPYAVRKPKQYAVSQPGDLVEVDTLEVRPVPGVVFKQFTARDVVSRWDVIQAHGRATAQSASEFLETLLHRMPFPVRALQVDGGSEFAAQFEQSCQQRGVRLFVLPPRSPKLNGAVERANRTHSEEFYQVTACSWEMKKLNRELRQWRKSTTPSVLTSRSATSLPASSCFSSHLNERNESVTNLLDEYTVLSRTTESVKLGCVLRTPRVMGR